MAGSLNTTLDNYPEELLLAAGQVDARLQALGVGGDDARRIGWEIAEHLRNYWGGRQIYLIKEALKTDPRQISLLDSADHAAGLNEREMLVDIAEQTEERLVAIGHAHDEANRLGWEVARHLNTFWGGGVLYICKGVHYEISLRDQEIYRRFNGTNHDWLATTYDLTVQHVYRIVKRVGAAELAKRQAQLFDTRV
jgi:Mor family transcriptional regulator